VQIRQYFSEPKAFQKNWEIKEAKERKYLNKRLFYPEDGSS
jgi:hypothetical protein